MVKNRNAAIKRRPITEHWQMPTFKMLVEKHFINYFK